MKSIKQRKWCNKCQQEKPAAEFYKHKQNGLTAWCILCTREAMRAYWPIKNARRRQGKLSQQERRALIFPEVGMKRCSKCKAVKMLSEFHNRGGKREGQYSAACADCRRGIWTAWHRRNGGKSRVEFRAAQWAARHPEEGKKFCRACGQVKNLEDFKKTPHSPDGRHSKCKMCLYPMETARRQKNVDYYRAKDKLWREQHRDSVRLMSLRYQHRRRAQIFETGGDYSNDQWLALCEQYGNKCLACGEHKGKLTADHVIPLSRGGSNDITNIQPLCASCNSRKHDQIKDYRPEPVRVDIAALRPSRKERRLPRPLVAGEKYCGGCEQIKLQTEFHRSKLAKDGLCTQCKSCAIARTHRWTEQKKAA